MHRIIKCKEQRYYYPYKINTRELFLVICASFMFICLTSFGLLYLENFLSNDVQAMSVTQAVSFYEYTQDSYLGQYGCIYTDGLLTMTGQNNISINILPN